MRALTMRPSSSGRGSSDPARALTEGLPVHGLAWGDLRSTGVAGLETLPQPLPTGCGKVWRPLPQHCLLARRLADPPQHCPWVVVSETLPQPCPRALTEGHQCWGMRVSPTTAVNISSADAGAGEKLKALSWGFLASLPRRRSPKEFVGNRRTLCFKLFPASPEDVHRSGLRTPPVY